MNQTSVVDLRAIVAPHVHIAALRDVHLACDSGDIFWMIESVRAALKADFGSVAVKPLLNAWMEKVRGIYDQSGARQKKAA